jgi:dipeptidyl aminopeptidase/acylaminoacyl peptidase
MRHLCSRISRRCWIVIAAAIIGGAFWLGFAGLGSTQTQPLLDLPPRPEVLTGSPEYVVHDAKVLDSDSPSRKQRAGDGVPGKVDALDIRQAYERANGLAAQTKSKVFKTTITPHWFDKNTRFWYRNDLADGAKEFVLVDAEKGTRQPAFDHKKLAEALAGASGKDYSADRLPFNAIQFSDRDIAVLFQAGGATWQCDLASYQCTRSKQNFEIESGADVPQKKKGRKKGGGFRPPQAKSQATSPDGKWTALTRDNNVYLRDKDDKETQFTSIGTAGNPFVSLTWAPDSKKLVMFRTEPGDNKEVYMIETSPKDQLPARLHKRVYPRPGDKFALHEIHVVDVTIKEPIKVDVERIDYGPVPRLHWSKDATHFTFEKTDRGHQRFRVIEVEACSGKARNIIDEKSETFIWTVHPPGFNEIPGIYVNYLDDSGEILLASERDGWKHFYLADARAGKIKNQITKGNWVIRGVDKVDVAKRQIWFRANGKNPDEDPYFVHYYRVNFDGTGLVALTQGNGSHSIQLSPDGQYLIDTYSRVDMPPVHELRRVSDGTLACKLEQADIAALVATGWRPPEVFVAKARDGQTDIWGIVCRPQKLDPSKKYPVIEYIYAGPHGSFTPKTFAAYRQMAALAELGFIVVQCDGMGTAHRSRAFHDVCWKNIADAGFPDRIAWIKALAKKYTYVDTTRVGIYGTSAGGQSSTGALLFHPEFYKVAVSSCGCHDNRLDKFSWNEQWMGLIGPHYEQQSNVTHAKKLQGKLLLIVGEMDTNVPFESTMRVVDALIKAGKDFNLIVVPGMGHSDGGPYGQRRRWDHFVRHLHGIEPPDRNLVSVVAKGT